MSFYTTSLNNRQQLKQNYQSRKQPNYVQKSTILDKTLSKMADFMVAILNLIIEHLTHAEQNIKAFCNSFTNF